MIEQGPGRRVRIWDLPIRLFHWLLVLLIPLAWWTAEKDALDLHVLAGMFVLGLLVFRILWGLIGSQTARFKSFVRGPGAVLDYLRGRSAHRIGHNPVGALSVIALLGLLSLQAGLGLFAGDEDGLQSGPLSYLVSFDLSDRLTDLHEDLFDLLLILIGLHVAAILFYALVKRQNLVGPMISGRGAMPPGTADNRKAPVWRFLLAASIAIAVAMWIFRGATV